jgi:hypothetical protein
MKKGILIFLVLFGVRLLVLYNLPLEVTQRTEIKRGNTLIENIEKHIKRNGGNSRLE